MCCNNPEKELLAYLFASRSRNNLSKPTSDGFACLMKFKNLREIELYLHATYINDMDINVQYEIQKISFVIDSTIDFCRLYSLQINRRRMATEANKESTKKRMATERNKERTKKRMATEKK